MGKILCETSDMEYSYNEKNIRHFLNYYYEIINDTNITTYDRLNYTLYMKYMGIIPDLKIYNSIIRLSATLMEAFTVLNFMLSDNVIPNRFTCSYLEKFCTNPITRQRIRDMLRE